MRSAAPDYSRSDDCTGIISPRHLQRIEALLTEAADRQSRIVTLRGDGDVDRDQPPHADLAGASTPPPT